MPNYPSSFTSGAAPGLRSVNNVTDRRDFQYFLEPSVASAAGFALSLATAAVLPNSPVYANNIITGSTAGTIVVDGSAYSYPTTSTTILVKNQASSLQNGIYKVTTVGASGASYVLTRDTRFDEDAEMKLDSIYSITSGTANASTKWYLNTAEPITLGTTNISFTQVPTSIDYNSAANYPTDVNVGISRLDKASDFINDFKSMINTVQKDLGDLETQINALDTTIGTKYLAASNINIVQHMHRRFEKLIFQIKRLSDDVDLMNDAGYFTPSATSITSIGVTGSYPSSKNRLTNVAGGF